MFDLSKEFAIFYGDHVKLSPEQKSSLRKYRDANIDRINSGLEDLGHSKPKATVNQGGYAMHSIVQHDENDYDIDIALVFNKGEISDDPFGARSKIRDAIVKAGGNFSRDPEVRTNAVTVWYQGGHHVDFAIYRELESDLQIGIPNIEHASNEWTNRNPSEITDWFNASVSALSPEERVGGVEKHQLRRVVQLLKIFAKSRKSWDLPGGLILSALAVENYSPDSSRDDIAFVSTLQSIRQRISASLGVQNPADPIRTLTNSEHHLAQVRRFGEKLDQCLPYLDTLSSGDCEKIDAVKAWAYFFDHRYWKKLRDEIEEALKEAAAITSAREKSRLSVTATGKLVTDGSGEQKVPRHTFYGDS